MSLTGGVRMPESTEEQGSPPERKRKSWMGARIPEQVGHEKAGLLKAACFRDRQKKQGLKDCTAPLLACPSFSRHCSPDNLKAELTSPTF